MSTNNKQTMSNQYDPTALSTYQGMQGGLGTAIGGYMNNPFSNPFMGQQQQMGNNQANTMGQTAMSNATRNWNMSGISGTSPMAMEMMNNQMRQNSQIGRAH